MKRTAFAFIALFWGLAGIANAGSLNHDGKVTYVLPKEFLKLSKSEGAVILDVRDESDPKDVLWDKAIALPEAEITKEKIAAITPDTSKPILLVCNYSFMPKKRAHESRAPLPVSATEQAGYKLLFMGYQQIYALKYSTDKDLDLLPLRTVKKEQK